MCPRPCTVVFCTCFGWEWEYSFLVLSCTSCPSPCSNPFLCDMSSSSSSSPLSCEETSYPFLSLLLSCREPSYRRHRCSTDFVSDDLNKRHSMIQEVGYQPNGPSHGTNPCYLRPLSPHPKPDLWERKDPTTSTRSAQEDKGTTLLSSC